METKTKKSMGAILICAFVVLMAVIVWDSRKSDDFSVIAPVAVTETVGISSAQAGEDSVDSAATVTEKSLNRLGLTLENSVKVSVK